MEFVYPAESFEHVQNIERKSLDLSYAIVNVWYETHVVILSELDR